MEKILIVEDNPVLLKILQSGMKKHDDRFATLTAKDGEEAIAMLEADPISLLVTDLQMPKVDGLTLLAYMNEHHPEIPCVVMSAHGTPQIKERVSRDVLRFIEKPFEIDELVETILPALEADEPGGTLSGISIANFLQMIHMEQKTCLLEIEITDGRRGYFYFEEGILFDAVLDDLNGEEAALALIPNERAKIRIKNLATGKKKVSRRIQKDLMALLMDAMRMADESAYPPEAGEPDGDLNADEAVDSEDLLDEELDEAFDFSDLDEPEPLSANEAAARTAEQPPRQTTSAKIAALLAGLHGVDGYRGSAVLDLSGEVLVQDAVEPDLDLAVTGAVVFDLFRKAVKTVRDSDLGSCRELLLTSTGGSLLCVSPPGERFCAVVLLGAGGNRALAKISLERIMADLETALG